MTELTKFEEQLTPIFGGDYFVNSKKFFQVQTDLKVNLSADEAGPRRYDENLELETLTYTQELADRRREMPLYPDEVQTEMDARRKGLLRRSSIVAGAFLIVAVLFMIFGNSPMGMRLIVGGVGTAIVLGAIAGRTFWSWHLFKLYIDKDVLYKLPDTDFVSTDEQSDFKRSRRQEDEALITRLSEMRSSALEVRDDLGEGTVPLYNLDRDAHLAVIALQSARDDDDTVVHGEYSLPERADLANAERYRAIRETHPELSTRSRDDLMRMELMIKTVEDRMGVTQ